MTTTQALTLDAIAATDGTLAIVAMDQRNTLRRMFAAAGIEEPSGEQLDDVKVAVARALTPLASGILLDPTIGVPAVTRAGALAGNCGLLIAAEPEVRGKYNGEPRSHIEPGQDAAWVRSLGGQAVKFLVQLRADRPAPGPGEPDIAAETLGVVRQVVADCRAAGIPSVIENLIYPLPGEDLTPSRRADAIISAAEALDSTGADLLKLEYPGSPADAKRLEERLTRPWAVLSAGVPFERFQEVLAVSYGEGGASGFIAGRSVWKEAVGMSAAEQQVFFRDTARPRLEALVEFSAGRARPWREAAGGGEQ